VIWQVYAWILLLLTATSWLGLPRAEISTRDLIDIPVSIVLVAGVFGYAFRKALVIPGFWRVWLVAQIVWDVSYNVLGLDREGRALVLYLVFTVPAYVALLLYGYFSAPLWRSRGRAGAES
jgi:hypothetical protein